ncbi:hypothetical protein DASC09_061940 [Saccharomycopsis crataegensis]|uniref:Uncharacterized protein n=1 Tax=Saccharomycopsis crataegensis TaxID=43959 RepID=A0AAV5QXL8_9ASCO|nr:hypothetical protein DASC09_061940 [Saccharomycopsis crataegensis]
MIGTLGLKSVALRSGSLNAVRYFRTVAPACSEYVKQGKDADPLLGGYPPIQTDLYFNRDPYKKYDDQQNRRNFDEPLDPEDDMKNMWSPDYYQPVSDLTALKYNGIFFGSLITIGTVLYFFFYPEKPAVPRNYPHGGLAKALGAGNEEEAKFLHARVDKTA